MAALLLAACAGCDAAKICTNKNDRLISGKIIPVCGATTERDGTRYSWRTDSGTCSCTLDTSMASGQSFWRACTFNGGSAAPLGEETASDPGGPASSGPAS